MRAVVAFVLPSTLLRSNQCRYHDTSGAVYLRSTQTVSHSSYNSPLQHFSYANSEMPCISNSFNYRYVTKLTKIKKQSSTLFLASVNDIDKDQNADDEITESTTNKLDEMLSSLTSAFPFFVFSAACLGVCIPSSLTWVSRSSNIIPIMLSSVMMGTGMTLEKKDFTNVLSKNFVSVPMGILCQFLIMPLSAFLVGHLFYLHPSFSSSKSALSMDSASALYLGLVLVGCSPGGTASNLVSLIAGADLALSVLLTSCSTIMASFVTPVLVQLLLKKSILGGSSGSLSVPVVQVNGMTLCTATAKVVLFPVLAGMFINSKYPKFSKFISRFTPFASVILVAMICGGVVAENVATMMMSSSGGGSNLTILPTIIKAVLLLHSIGFTVGYLIPKIILFLRQGANDENNSMDKLDQERTSRTISIETGMQNSALAVVLARSIGAHPLSSLPGALSATVHSCLGSILAAYWRLQDKRDLDKKIKSK